MRLRRTVPALLAFACAAPAFAGAWTQPQGHGLFIAQATYFRSSEFFDDTGALVSQPTYSKYELQPYAEYGVRDWLTVGGTAYLQRAAQSGDSNWGIADPELFARLRVWHNDHHVVAIQPLVKLPSVFTDSGTPRGGSRSLDAELSVLYGRSMEIFGMQAYSDVRAGYRVRGRGLNPQYRVDSAAGIFLTDKLQVIGAFRGVLAADYDENAPFREDGEQDYDLAKIELTAAYHVSDTRWVHATIFDHVSGAFTGAGRGISLGYAEGF